MASSATAVMKELRAGRTIPVYAYANGNPVAYSDPTGLIVVLPTKMGLGLRTAINHCLQSKTCQKKWNAMKASSTIFMIKEYDPKAPGHREGVGGQVTPTVGQSEPYLNNLAMVEIKTSLIDSRGWFNAGHEFTHAERLVHGSFGVEPLPDVDGHAEIWEEKIRWAPDSTYGYGKPYSEDEYQAVKEALKIAKELGHPMRTVNYNTGRFGSPVELP